QGSRFYVGCCQGFIKERAEGYSRRIWDLCRDKEKSQKRAQSEDRTGYQHPGCQDTEVFSWQGIKRRGQKIRNPSPALKGQTAVCPFNFCSFFDILFI